MTETTAKKGMTRYKTGYSKSDFNYDYVASVNYDEKRTLKQVIETLFNENKSLKEKLVETENNFNEQIEQIKQNYDDKFTKLNETFEQNIKDFLTRGL